MFPALTELEIAQIKGLGSLDHTRCIGFLVGLPQLRILKFSDIKFTADHPNPLGRIVVSQHIALEALEELTLQELSVQSLACILDFLCAPNLQLLSWKKVELHNSYIDVTQEKVLFKFTNLRNLHLEFTPGHVDKGWMWKWHSSMPRVTSVHFDSASQDFAIPLIRPFPGPPDTDMTDEKGAATNAVGNIVIGLRW